MPDSKRVVEALEYALNDEINKREMTVKMSFEVVEIIVDLLKEQEAVAIVWKFGFPHCPVCGQMLPEGDAVKYCLHCGRAVKWE